MRPAPQVRSRVLTGVRLRGRALASPGPALGSVPSTADKQETSGLDPSCCVTSQHKSQYKETEPTRSPVGHGTQWHWNCEWEPAPGLGTGRAGRVRGV